MSKWPRIQKKAAKSKLRVESHKKTVARLQLGLPAEVASQAQSVIELLNKARPKSGGDPTESVEAIVSMAESITSTFLEAAPVEFGVEVPGVADARRLGGLSALLVANQVRGVVKYGSGQQFERLYQSLAVLQRLKYDDNRGDNVLLDQWLSVELPLMLGVQLAGIKHFRAGAKQAAKTLAEIVAEVVDADGWPGSSCLSVFPTIVASWARSLRMMEKLELELDSKVQSQVAWIAEQFVRLHGVGRKPIFAHEDYDTCDPALTQLVLEMSDDVDANAVAKAAGLVKPKQKKKPAKKKAAKNKADKKEIKLPEPSSVSEWSSSGILKSSWKSGLPYVGIDFGSAHNRLEIGARDLLISGRCPIKVSDDGEALDFDSAGFEVVCDLHEDDVSYLELEISAGDLTVYRQVLLARDDKFVFLADAVHKKGAGDIAWSMDLPLANGVTVMPENGTRELYLYRNGIESLVLPLALPEWSSERRRESRFEATQTAEGQHQLSLAHAAQLRSDGGALYFPVFIDLDPRRSCQKRTWRQLTVAESLRIVRPEEAAAFRVQVDRKQWVFYRALQRVANRTFMGENFAGDFFAGEFKKSGDVSELLQVQ